MLKGAAHVHSTYSDGLKGGKQVLDRIGIGVPESLKSQLRRIF